MKNFLFLIIGGLPLLWTVGIHVIDIARICLPFLIALGFLKPKIRQIIFLQDQRFLRIPLTIFIFSFALFAFIQPVLQVYLGEHGIDFAIFTQVVDSVSRRGAPLTSLIGMEWRNFLSHHFTPFLYLPGALGFFKIPAYFSISLFHALGIASAGVALGYAAKYTFNYSTIFTLFIVTLLYANPSFRHGILFGVHDEIFALPFIGMSYLMFLKRKHLWTILSLVGASLTKESMFLVASAFGVMAIIDLQSQKAKTLDAIRAKQQLFYGVIVLYGLIGFCSYAFLQPILAGKEFDHVNKLASFNELTRTDWMGGKIYFLFFLLLPFLAYPLWRKSSWHLIIPALPLLSFSLVSRFDEMWKPLNYYGVAPTYIIAFASLISFARNKNNSTSFPLKAYTAALLISLAFCWSGAKPAKTIARVIQKPIVRPIQFSFIPTDAKVIADPAGTLMLLRTNIIWRLWLANQTLPDNFDYIVTLAENEHEISPGLRSNSIPCHQIELWRIYCRVKH